MTFTYTYRTSDGQRHSAEIEAESRDAAFAKVRSELGVKPIKVVAAAPDGSSEAARFGSSLAASAAVRRHPAPSNSHTRTLANSLTAIAALAAIALGAWLLLRRGASEVVTVMTPSGPATLTVAAPLPRQAIPGDRRRIDAARETAFRLPAERHLARFAEPGRAVPPPPDGGPAYRPPAEADFRAALREPVRTLSTDFTEVVDLKRIVAGMKREMAAYLAGGGTVEGYLAELERRQKLEISYRENAERRLGELLEKALRGANPGGPQSLAAADAPHEPRATLSSAYAYWLKANAQLKSMGIYELPLPDALRSYQSSLDIEE